MRSHRRVQSGTVRGAHARCGWKGPCAPFPLPHRRSGSRSREHRRQRVCMCVLFIRDSLFTMVPKWTAEVLTGGLKRKTTARRLREEMRVLGMLQAAVLSVSAMLINQQCVWNKASLNAHQTRLYVENSMTRASQETNPHRSGVYANVMKLPAD